MQVIAHIIEGGHMGLSVWMSNKLDIFALTPWLYGHLALMPTRTRYRHGQAPEKCAIGLVAQMHADSVDLAIEAIKHENIAILGEAVTITYLAQKLMGAQTLPDLGEEGKKYTGKYGLYVFSDLAKMTEPVRKASVLHV